MILEKVGCTRPILQAPMGGGISRHELAAAVSDAGGLGTIAVNGAQNIAHELAAARKLTDKPIAVGLLLPFARRDWLEAAAKADVIVTFWGKPKRPAATTWMHQCGSVGEAVATHAAGADAVIVQGVEAGGHVRGKVSGPELLERVRKELPAGYPLLLAGGIASSDDVSRALEAGAEAAVVGTRFIATDESRASDSYKQRVIAATGADDTVLTELFGLGWPAAPHRVLRNAATERWLGEDDRVSSAVRVINRLSGLGPNYKPPAIQAYLARNQTSGRPLLSPLPPTDDRGENLLDGGPLYAGMSVGQVNDLQPAGQLTASLTP